MAEQEEKKEKDNKKAEKKAAKAAEKEAKRQEKEQKKQGETIFLLQVKNISKYLISSYQIFYFYKT